MVSQVARVRLLVERVLAMPHLGLAVEYLLCWNQNVETRHLTLESILKKSFENNSNRLESNQKITPANLARFGGRAGGDYAPV